MKLSRWMTGVAMAAFLSMPAAAAQAQDKAEVALRTAIEKETVEGDLKGAIEQYKKLAQGSHKPVAARALVRLGGCYEKQGSADARKTYEQVLSKFGDQKDAVEQARVRLAALGGAPGRPTTEKISDDHAAIFFSNVSMDRPLVTFTDWQTGDLMLRDLVTGETRNLTRNGADRKGKEHVDETVISADGQMVVYGWHGYSVPSPGNGLDEIRSINSDGTSVRTHLSRKVFPIALSPNKKTVLVTPGGRGSPGPVEALSLVDNSLKPFAEGLRVSGASFSPDGKQVVLSADQTTAGVTGRDPLLPKVTGRDLFLANADGSGVRPLQTEWGNDDSPFWTADGKWIVFLSDRTGNNAIWAIPSSGGTPRMLKEVNNIESFHGVTRDGSLYYHTDASQYDVHIVQLDPAGLAIVGEPRRFTNALLGRNGAMSFSPDGKWKAWLGAPRVGQLTLVVRPVVGEAKGMDISVSYPSHLYGPAPRWFPDSKALLNRRFDHGDSILERVEVPDGRITEIRREVYHKFFSVVVAPDGNTLLELRCDEQTKPCEIARYDLRTKSETVETLDEIRGGYPQTPIEISPDGKWLAMIGDLPSGSGKCLFVKPVTGGKLVELARRTDTESFGMGLAWTPDSKQIVYVVKASSGGTWQDKEFRAVPVGGGAPKIIALTGNQPSFDPGGRLAYTVETLRIETWVTRNLLPSN